MDPTRFSEFALDCYTGQLQAVQEVSGTSPLSCRALFDDSCRQLRMGLHPISLVQRPRTTLVTLRSSSLVLNG